MSPHPGTADPTALLAARSRLTSGGALVLVEALLVHAIVPVLVAHPEFNAALDDETHFCSA